MARQLKLKVFRMPIGFHDAYVAAPSQKAAAEAWGTDASVFPRGEAERVTDPKLSEEPLANPGKVIKRLRGTAAEQLAALGESEETPKLLEKGKAPAKPRSAPKPPPKPKPRPSRAKLEEAEGAIAEAEARHQATLDAVAKREAELARERVALEAKQAAERERLEARRDRARDAYEAALAKWRVS